MGLNLVIDYNEETQSAHNIIPTNESQIMKFSHDDSNTFSINLDAISILIFMKKKFGFYRLLF